MVQTSIGRIDFAGLTTFQNAGWSEVALLNQYFAKDHNYRNKLLAWQSGTVQGLTFYNHFQFSDPSHNDFDMCLDAIKLSDTLFGTQPSQRVVGDCFLQLQRPSSIALLAGPGAFSGVNENYGVPLQHYTSDLLTIEPQVAFYNFFGSYIGDWYTVQDSFMRSLLAKPSYGLVALWKYDRMLDVLGLGVEVGRCLLYEQNDMHDSDFSRRGFGGVSVIGDPTLRLHVLAPPLNVRYDESAVRWDASPEASDYFVYWAPAAAGPFTSLGRVSGTTSLPTDSRPCFMVRAVKQVTSGCSRYENLSQGAYSN